MNSSKKCGSACASGSVWFDGIELGHERIVLRRCLVLGLEEREHDVGHEELAGDVGIGGWSKVFGDEVTAGAIADRVCHHCTLIKITGRSYRLKDLPADKRREG